MADEQWSRRLRAAARQARRTRDVRRRVSRAGRAGALLRSVPLSGRSIPDAARDRGRSGPPPLLFDVVGTARRRPADHRQAGPGRRGVELAQRHGLRGHRDPRRTAGGTVLSARHHRRDRGVRRRQRHHADHVAGAYGVGEFVAADSVVLRQPQSRFGDLRRRADPVGRRARRPSGGACTTSTTTAAW